MCRRIFSVFNYDCGKYRFDPNHYDDEAVERAAKIAQVHDNIIEFPQQFQTRLGERGVSLSGGQRQRISMARALIKNPAILIFDDSLSAVDADTEERILQGLKKVMKGRRRLSSAIAFRPSAKPTKLSCSITDASSSKATMNSLSNWAVYMPICTNSSS